MSNAIRLRLSRAKGFDLQAQDQRNEAMRKPREKMVSERNPYLNAFDQLILDTGNKPNGREWIGFVINVADTMYLCKQWFEAHDVQFAAADVISMAKLVMEHEWRHKSRHTTNGSQWLSR